jgi:predicted dehydrogenase
MTEAAAMTSDGARPVRIGLIGAGAIMRLSHAPTIAGTEAATLAAIYDPAAERAAALAARFGGRVYGELAALLAANDVDAVIIATPNRDHCAAVIAAAAAGKHVFCEKPLAINLAEARQMVAACSAADVRLQVGFNQRFWPQVGIAKSLIESGFIGKVHQFRSVYGEKADAYPAATSYRYDLSQSGGATIIDLMIHRIDLARHILGEFSSVFSELVHSSLPQPVDDNVWLLGRLASGARGCLTSNRFSPNIADGTDFYGTTGTIHLTSETLDPFHAAPLAVYTEKTVDELPDILREAHYPEAWWKTFSGGWITIKPPRRNPYAAQLAAFCAAIRTGRMSGPTGDDGLKAQEVVQASYLSMAKGGWIDLPLPDQVPFALPDYAATGDRPP